MAAATDAYTDWLATFDPAAHEGLVWRSVRKFRWACGAGLGLEDLAQAGRAGVLYASTKYDPSRGIKFNTYAVWWIRHFVTKEAYAHCRTVRVPQKVARNAYVTGEAKSLVNVPLHTVGCDDQGSAEWRMGQAVGTLDVESPDEAAGDEEQVNQVAAALAQLSPREQLVLRLTYFRDRNLAEVGRELGISRERARQLRERALDKLRVIMGAPEPENDAA